MTIINPTAGNYEQQAYVKEVKRAKRTTESKANTTGASGELKTDKVSLSGVSKDMQIAKEAIEAAPELRNEKIDMIKRQVNEGQYTVKPEKIAEKIISLNIDTLS